MNPIVFLTEEQSTVEMLKGFLPKLLRTDQLDCCVYISFEGKQDLEKQLVRKIRGYQHPTARFIVMRDQDAGDCKDVKKKLLDLCKKSEKQGRTWVRILCRELESWYLADLTAVEQALEIPGLRTKQETSRYRSPDSMGNKPSKELERISNNKYQKISGSRLIGPHLDPDNSRSKSFQVFVNTIRSLTVSP